MPGSKVRLSSIARMAQHSPDGSSAASGSASPLAHPGRVHPYACRHMLLLVCGAWLLLVCLPYLLAAPAHSNSCYVVRSSRAIHSEQILAERRITDLTGGVDPPAVDSIESSPLSGRRRQPAIFFKFQTAWMIALLLLCVAIKMAHAFLFMKPAVAAALEGESTKRGKSNGSSASASSAAAPFAFHWYEVFRLAYAYAFYLSAYFACNALKAIIGDKSCSDHGNSVSGHYLFFVYNLLSLAYLHLSQRGLHGVSVLSSTFWRRLFSGSKLDHAFLVSYALFSAVCLSILADTYFFGFHSLRQIIYGFAMALLVFLAATGVFEAMEDRLARRKGYVAARRLPAVRNDSQHRARPPQLSVAYSATVSSLLYEWLYSDESAGRFYTFPLATLAAFQLASWMLMTCAPQQNFHAADIVAVSVTFAVLSVIAHTKLRTVSVYESKERASLA